MANYGFDRSDERFISDYERRQEAGECVLGSIKAVHYIRIIRKCAKKVGIKNNIYDVSSDWVVHFDGLIAEEEMREAFKKAMEEETGRKWRVSALYF